MRSIPWCCSSWLVEVAQAVQEHSVAIVIADWRWLETAVLFGARMDLSKPETANIDVLRAEEVALAVDDRGFGSVLAVTLVKPASTYPGDLRAVHGRPGSQPGGRLRSLLHVAKRSSALVTSR